MAEYRHNLGLLFQTVVNRHAHRTALNFGNAEQYTYHELDLVSDQCAGLLLNLNIKKGHIVALDGHKIVEIYALILACIKLGVTYTVLDPDSPPERSSRILSTCRPNLYISDSETGHTPESEFQTLRISELVDQIRTAEPTPHSLYAAVIGTAPAYIMFTSGSTGFPKGVVIRHYQVLNFIQWCQTAFALSEQEILTQANPLFFDNSVFDLYSSLFTGAELGILSKADLADPQQLVTKVEQLKCTLWFSVPSLLIYLTTMKALTAANFSTLKKIVFGGEGYPKAQLKKLFDLYGERTTFFNVYGPTEGTCMCASHVISPADFKTLEGFPQLGQIAGNFDYYIVDESGKQCPENAPGELLLKSPNVSSGYINNPEQTQSRFIPDPFSQFPDDIVYKTGDIVKYNSEIAGLEILGRTDNQIKHMGYRIELEEIETSIARLPYVNQVGVVHGQIRGLSRIIGIVSCSNSISEAEIKQDLAPFLPAYMMPHSIYFSDALPRNANGKVDRIALKNHYIPDN